MSVRNLTYKEIQKRIKKQYGVYVKTCWIADVKAYYGLTRGPAPNRKGTTRINPCPSKYWSMIENTLGM